MFKSARWRSEKNTIKAVFKLQFHATQVPKLGWNALMISVVPADVGKPTLRLEKAAVRDGSCYWENSVYETVKFIREPKTGKIHERIYHFEVSNGSSKSALLGEVSIDLANYALATKLSSVSLPLKNAKSEGVLHVSIQRMPETADQREFEEKENAKNSSQDTSLKTQLSNGHTDGTVQDNSIEDGPFNKTISYTGDLNGNHRASNESDVTISSSDSSSGLDTPRELGLKNNNSDQDHTSFLLSHLSVPQKPTSDASKTVYEEHQRSQWEWLGDSALEVSTDDSLGSPRDTLLIEGSQETSDIMVEKLKTEISSLARLAEVSELELQTLRKQIVKEGKRGQDLSREVVSLKDERDALKEECEKLKAFRKRIDEVKVENRLKYERGDPRALSEELRQELNYEKDLNVNLRLQLQKTLESNSELILAVRDLDEMLEQKNMEISNLSRRSAICENAKELWETNSKSESEYDEEQMALEELVEGHSNAKEAHLLEQKILDLYSELEIYKGDKDELEMQMQQLALDYEILTQQNHDLSYKLEQSQLQEQLKMQFECSPPYATINELETQVENLENELKKQSKELSDSLATINELETHVKGLEEELEKQALRFEDDLEALTHAKIEQEQRAIQAEEALRKARQQNANTAERLQEEFRRLSVQMTSTFEANEKLATKAMTEARELQLQKYHLGEMLQKAKEELQFAKEHYEANLHELSSQISSLTNHIEHMQSETEEKSKRLEYQKKHEEETHEVLSQEILMLRAKIETLTTENKNLSEEPERRETLEAELKQMKISMKEAEMLVQRGNLERNEMENIITLLRKEAEKTLEELHILRSLKDEKETIVGNLQSEVETLKDQCNESKHSLFKDELEKEKLRKQVFQLKSDLKKKEDAFSSIEKKLKDSKSRVTVSDGVKATMGNNKSAPVPRGSKEVASMKDKIKLLEAQIKLKETALETSTNSFLEKEKDLQNKIEELERRLDELNHNSFHEYEFPKVTCNMEDGTLNGNAQQKVRNTVENLSSMGCMSNENVSAMSLMKSNERNLDELLKEMALLKERNELMEGELKDMQERYSEISLKFAEVEGERQQLVMTVRNLKNSKKN